MIKWFDSRVMTGLPQLSNTQGDLVKMLTGLLVNGVNSKSIIRINYSNGFCELNIGASHGFIVNSVISIKGSKQTAFLDKEYRIISSTSTTIKFACEHLAVDEIGLTVCYAPIGWDAYFDSADRACYKSKNKKYPAYIRVDDRRFGGTSPNAAKFAGVELCLDMTDFDTASRQTPISGVYPTQNREYIEGRSNGWFKWYYSSGYNQQPDVTANTNTLSNYVLIGDESSFYLITHPYGGDNSALGGVMGVALVDDGLQESQVLIAKNQAIFRYSNPHESFMEETTAETYQTIGFSLSGIPVGTHATHRKISGLIDGKGRSNMLMKSPIYLFNDGKFNSFFKGIEVLPKTLPSAGLVESSQGKYFIADIGLPYQLAFFCGA